MKLRYTALTAAVACALASQAGADEAAAKKLIDAEFQRMVVMLSGNP